MVLRNDLLRDLISVLICEAYFTKAIGSGLKSVMLAAAHHKDMSVMHAVRQTILPDVREMEDQPVRIPDKLS